MTDGSDVRSEAPGFWREVPCGHPSDPVAATTLDGYSVCHCGWILDSAPVIACPPEAPGPVVPCAKCGCYVAVPARSDITALPSDSAQ